jgi:heme/copper-type cytochrome/quinol oxidase subunit 3
MTSIGAAGDREPAAVARSALSTRALTTEEPVGRSTGWWGMVLFITTEATLFAALLGSYFYLRFQDGPHWPPGGIKQPDLLRPLIMTAVLVASCLPVAWAQHGARRARYGQVRLGLVATTLLGLAFLWLEGVEHHEKLQMFTITTNVYGSLFYAITVFDAVHVVVGLILVGWLLGAAMRGNFGPAHRGRVQLAALYWYFVVVVWAAILFTIYLSPRL